MIGPDLNFFEQSLTAVINDISTRLSAFSEYVKAKIPVYILNTGDHAFLSSISGNLKNTDKSVSESVPRITLDFTEILVNSDALTNPYVTGFFVKKVGQIDKEFRSNVRRIPCTIPLTGSFVLSNTIQYMSAVQYVLSAMFKNNRFEFIYAGKTYEGSWTIDDSFTNEFTKTIVSSPEARTHALPMSISVDVQMPAFDVFGDNHPVSSDKIIETAYHRISIGDETELVSKTSDAPVIELPDKPS